MVVMAIVLVAVTFAAFFTCKVRTVELEAEPLRYCNEAKPVLILATESVIEMEVAEPVKPVAATAPDTTVIVAVIVSPTAAG